MNSQLADKQGDRPFLPVGIAVLTISDTRSLSDDRSGEALAGRIEEAGHRLVDRTIAKDEREAIQSAVKAWVARDDIDVVITTGGTGFTGRDIPPEALEPPLASCSSTTTLIFVPTVVPGAVISVLVET